MKTIPQASPIWRAARFEMLLGRSAAMCAHPCAAWRVGTRLERLGLLAAYAAAGYAIVLGTLFVR